MAGDRHFLSFLKVYKAVQRPFSFNGSSASNSQTLHSQLLFSTIHCTPCWHNIFQDGFESRQQTYPRSPHGRDNCLHVPWSGQSCCSSPIRPPFWCDSPCRHWRTIYRSIRHGGRSQSFFRPSLSPDFGLEDHGLRGQPRPCLGKNCLRNSHVPMSHTEGLNCPLSWAQNF